ncbi:MAG: hypothetical protein Q8K75_10330 [Chlamydiales bacterium]|nr:hypothetical protein [Chlamydiales bacterium]
MLSQAPRVTDIRNFLIVLGSGVGVACAIVALMVYIYSPTGRYWSQHAIISPAVLASGSFSETIEGTTKVQRYQFDKVDYTYFDKEQAKWLTVALSNEQYQKFWALIEKDWSIPPNETLIQSFRDPKLSHLSIWVKPDPGTSPIKAIQEVFFVPNSDIYRVELRGTDLKDQWAYFVHSNIYQQVHELFVNRS